MRGFKDSEGNSIKGFEIYTEDGHNIVLLKDYIYERKDGCIVPIPKGTLSDGASTPQIMWNQIPPFGSYWMAAVLHDCLYRHANAGKDFCDETLLDAMEFLNTPWVLAKAIYEGVHLAGESSYAEDMKAWLIKTV